MSETQQGKAERKALNLPWCILLKVRYTLPVDSIRVSQCLIYDDKAYPP
jgi:hypothetical protein